MKLTEVQIRSLTRRIIKELFTKKGIGMTSFIGREKVDPWGEDWDDGGYDESDDIEDGDALHEDDDDLNEDDEG